MKFGINVARLPKCAAATLFSRSIKGLIKHSLCRAPPLLATSPAKSVLRSHNARAEAHSLLARLSMERVCNFRLRLQKAK